MGKSSLPFHYKDAEESKREVNQIGASCFMGTEITRDEENLSHTIDNVDEFDEKVIECRAIACQECN